MPNLPSLYAAPLVAASSTTSKSSAASGISSLIFIALLVLIAYFLFIRPRSQQARRQRESLQDVTPGDEVLTGAGIFGRVLDVEPDRVTIETAPGTRLTILRSTIARRITEPIPTENASWSDDDRDGGSSAPRGNSEGDVHEIREALGKGNPGPESTDRGSADRGSADRGSADRGSADRGSDHQANDDVSGHADGDSKAAGEEGQ